MNQKSSSRVNQFETIPTLYTTCLNYVCVNIELLTRTVKTTLPTGQKSHQHRHHHHNYTHCPYYHSIEFRQKTVSLNHVISEDLVERLSALNKITDSTLSLFGTASSVCCLKKLHLKNCLIGKDVLKLVLKNQNIDELKLNNIQIHAPPVIYGTAQSINFGAQSDLSSNPPNTHHEEIMSSSPMTIPTTTGLTVTSTKDTSQSPLNINELVESLTPWSKSNLKSFNVARNPSLFSSILINMRPLANSLTRLNVSFTSFNNHSLDIICQDLPRIEYLDISGTKVNELGPLIRLSDTLRGLFMYHMRASLTNDIVEIICSLSRLTNLDLSCDISTKIFADTNLSVFDVNFLLAELTKSRLVELKYLDISGKTGIKQEVLHDLLETYPKLKFLGLALTTANSFEMFNRPVRNDENISSSRSPRLTRMTSNSGNASLHLSASSPSLTRLLEVAREETLLSSSRAKSISKAALSSVAAYFDNLVVTGESNEAQTIAALKAYKHRLVYVQKALYHLYILTRNAATAAAAADYQNAMQTPRIDLLDIVTEVMQLHAKSQSVQLAATTCIFNLTRDNLYTSVPAHVLTKVINLVLTTMINYPNCQTNFNKFVCVKATLECLGTFTSDANLTNSSIAICSQAALSAEHKYRVQFGKLNEPKYVQRLIQIINSCMERFANDSILHSVLDILWSLSEENTDWCCNFITQNGLNAYVGIIDLFENDFDAVRKSMNMIYNLSEIAQIRPILFCHPISNVVKRMLYHEDQRVSFLATGFFVNLLAYMPDSNWDWHASLINPSKISEFKQELESIIENWSLVETSNSQIFLHHSRTSLLGLFNMSDEPAAQMWALWAIYFSFRFIPSIESAEFVKNTIKSTITDNKSTEKVSNLCSHILDLIQTTNFIKY